MRHITPTVTDSYGSFYILQKFLAMTQEFTKANHWYVHAKDIGIQYLMPKALRNFPECNWK